MKKQQWEGIQGRRTSICSSVSEATGSHKQEVTMHNDIQYFRLKGGWVVGCKVRLSPRHLQGAQQKVLAAEPATSTSALIRMSEHGVGTSGCIVLVSVRTPLVTDTMI